VESLLYKQLGGKKVQCQACQRRCLINDQSLGFCLARQNVGGVLESLLQGQITGIQIDPIEKKPFYHFKPGTEVATIGSWGCNFRCKQCLNYASSWGATEVLKNLRSVNERQRTAVAAKEIAQKVVFEGYQGLAFSYNEPAIWVEFAAEVAREFKTLGGQFCVFVTNGSWTKETIDLLTQSLTPKTQHSVPLIDAANIDLKGFREETYRRQGAFLGEIPEMAVYAQKKGIFLELTTLLIPGINDDPAEIRDLTRWIVKNLGPDTPWHLSQFEPQLAPDPEFEQIPQTPPEMLERAAGIGKKAGLHHIYIWAPASNCARSDTFCPNCQRTVIKRLGWEPVEIHLREDGICEYCGYKLNVKL